MPPHNLPQRWVFGDLVIAVASARDVLPLVALRRDVLGEGSWFVQRPEEYTRTADETEARMNKLAASGDGVTLVARLPQARVAGFLTLERRPVARMRHVAYLEVAVAHAFRGAGVGRGLMMAGMDWARAHPELQKVGLAVFADNERAVALYQAFGFVIEGRRVGEYLMEDGSLRDDLLMGCAVRGGPVIAEA